MARLATVATNNPQVKVIARLAIVRIPLSPVCVRRLQASSAPTHYTLMHEDEFLARMARAEPGALARRSELPDQAPEYAVTAGIERSRLVLSLDRGDRQVPDCV